MSTKHVVVMTSSHSGSPPVAIIPDTNIVSGLAKGDLPPEQLTALGQIADAVRDSSVTIWPTTNVRQELSRIPVSHRGSHMAVYSQWREIPGYPSTQTLPELKLGARVGEVYGRLRTVLPDEPDAQIAAAAFQSGVPYVVTYDLATFRQFSREVEKICGVRVRTPSELVGELNLRST